MLENKKKEINSPSHELINDWSLLDFNPTLQSITAACMHPDQKSRIEVHDIVSKLYTAEQSTAKKKKKKKKKAEGELLE